MSRGCPLRENNSNEISQEFVKMNSISHVSKIDGELAPLSEGTEGEPGLR